MHGKNTAEKAENTNLKEVERVCTQWKQARPAPEYEKPVDKP